MSPSPGFLYGLIVTLRRSNRLAGLPPDSDLSSDRALSTSSESSGESAQEEFATPLPARIN